MIFVILVGMPGSGKSTIGRNLSVASDKINWIRSREIIQHISGSSTTQQMQSDGLKFTERHDSEVFIKETITHVVSEKLNIFDSVRPRAHWETFKEIFGEGAILTSVDAPKLMRANRLLSRDVPEKIEERDNHIIEKDVPWLMREAQINVVNEYEIQEACFNLIHDIFLKVAPNKVTTGIRDETIQRLSEHDFSV